MNETLAAVERANWIVSAWNCSHDQSDVSSAWVCGEAICGPILESRIYSGIGIGYYQYFFDGIGICNVCVPILLLVCYTYLKFLCTN